MTIKCYKAFNKFEGVSYNAVCGHVANTFGADVNVKVSENGQRIGFYSNGRLVGMYDENKVTYYEYK